MQTNKKNRTGLRQVLLLAAVSPLALLLGSATAEAACTGNSGNKAQIHQANNLSANENASVTLNAGGGAKGTLFTWSRVSGPAVVLSPNTGESIIFTAPKVLTGHSGVLVIRQTATGCSGTPVSDFADVSINLTNLTNANPIANASASSPSVTSGTQVFLSGAGSYDPDSDAISYAWTQLSGSPAVTILGADSASASFVAPPVAATTTFQFRLTVTETVTPNLTGTATVSVNVVVANQPPVAQVSCPSSVNEGASVTLDGSASSDPENGALVYAWDQRSGFPLATLPAAPHGNTITFTAPNLGYQQTGLVAFGLTVTDNGNASDSTADAECTFFIKDITAPVLSGAVDLLKEATSPAGATASYSISAFDNVDGNSLAACSPVSGSTFPLGETTVNCSKSDSAVPANTGTASFKVTVVDSTAPVIAAHGDVEAEATSSAGAVVEYDSPATSDDYDGAGTATCSPASNTQFALGSTTVTCNASDANGNAASATTFQVIVADTTAPSITAPADVTVEADAFLTVVDFGTATGDDAVGPVTITHDWPGGGFPVGETIIEWLATDGASNSSSATSTVTVTDTTAPVVDDNEDQTLEATGPDGAPATFDAPAANDLVDGLLVSTCDFESGATFPIATTTVTCSATDTAGNTGSSSFDITVEDTEPPVVDDNVDQTLEATGPDGAVAIFDVPAANDIVDGAMASTCDFESGATFPIDTTTVTCSATDAAGNTGSSSFDITVEDTTAPEITPHGNVTAEATGPSGAAVGYTKPTASDIVDGPVTVNCLPLSGSVFSLGTTTVNCSATDAAGNSASSSFGVTVQDTTAPSIAPHGNVTAEATGPSGAAVGYSNPTAVDLVDGAVTVTCSPVSGSVFGLGSTTVNCSATDAAGNGASSSFSVTVQDTTAPEIAFHADVNAIATSAAGALVNYTAPTASDLVTIPVSVSCLPASGQFAVGTTVVNCSSTDAAGNTGHSSFNVIVSYAFNGFFRPIDNLPMVNVVKAGQAIPVKFSLGGNMGLGIMATGYPRSQVVSCAGGVPDEVEETVTAGGSSLSYDPITGQYIYVWKSEKNWAGACRQLQVRLIDGTYRTANFNFTR